MEMCRREQVMKIQRGFLQMGSITIMNKRWNRQVSMVEFWEVIGLMDHSIIGEKSYVC
jgi:hypothetical protein